MGKPIEESITPEPVIISHTAISETDEKISVEVNLKDAFVEGYEGAISTLENDKEETLREGVSCVAEILLLTAKAAKVTKPIEIAITDYKGEKYKMTFEKI